MEKEEKRQLLTKLFIERGITSIAMEYSGSGDSGAIDVVVFTNSDGRTATSSEWPPEMRPELQAMLGEETERFINYVEEIGYDLLEEHWSGWENNDGASGTITINVAAQTYEIDHNIYYTESTPESAEGKI